jgi:hypothetical protein
MEIARHMPLSFIPDNSRSWVISVGVKDGELAGKRLVAPVIGWAVIVGYQPMEESSKEARLQACADTTIEPVVFGHDQVIETIGEFTGFGFSDTDTTYQLHSCTAEEWQKALLFWATPIPETLPIVETT